MAKRHSTPRICSVEQCDQPHYGLGYCSRHYQRFKSHGSVAAKGGIRDKICTVNGCDRLHYGLGLCAAHYKRMRKYGNPLGESPKKTRSVCNVPSCNKPRRGLGYCSAHYWRFKQYGDALAGRIQHGEPLAWLLDNLKSPDPDECIIWPYATDGKHGYGRVLFEGKYWNTHRLALCLFTDQWPDRKTFVCHKPIVCHNPSCVNPHHLRFDTPASNTHDRKADGTACLGIQSPLSKLTNENVIDIFQSKLPTKTLAEIYGVSKSSIVQIKAGKTWVHVTSALLIPDRQTGINQPEKQQ